MDQINYTQKIGHSRLLPFLQMWNAKYSNSSHPYANSALHQTWIFTSGQSPDWVVTLIALPMLRPEQLLSGEECLAWQISLQVLSPIKLQKKKFMGNCKSRRELTLKAGGNIYRLSRHLGHSSVKVTEQNYLGFLTVEEQERVQFQAEQIFAAPTTISTTAA
nr:hypothetical protein [Komagataeibacter europaeus]